MLAKTLLRNIRLVSGLVLMVFVISHLTNLSLGLHSLAAMEAWRAHLLGPWRALPGAALLTLAAGVHATLGLYAMSQRRWLAMSRAQALKRLEAALKAVGVPFADDRQIVYLQQTADSLDIAGAAPA